jgi:hypothetical protein
MFPSRLRSLLRKSASAADLPSSLALRAELEHLRMALGRIESRYARSSNCPSINDAEFSVYSQFGEDGMIQYLLARVPVETKTFVEIGVESYEECNTRFLLLNDYWEGIAFDSGTNHIEQINQTSLGWRNSIRGVSTFITRDNINPLLSESGFIDDIGLFSLDIDGNDYWVFESLSACSPRIVVIEYNSIFGPTKKLVVPYQEDFNRTLAHHSNLFWGCSLAAVCDLADKKGYRFVGSNRAGNNAFFVRADVAYNVAHITPESGYFPSRFRESRDTNGAFTFLTAHSDRIQQIGQCEILDLETNSLRRLADLFN